MKTKILNTENKNALKGTLFFTLLWLLFSAALCSLYLHQSVSAMYDIPLWESDMKAYILEMLGKESGYCFPYPVLFKLGALFHLFLSETAAMAAAVTVLHALAILTAYYFIRKAVLSENSSLLRELTAAALTVALFLVSMLFDPRKSMYPIYVGVETPNPFHNATSVAAKPFALAAFFTFCALMERKDGPIEIREAVVFALSCLLCVMAKPSYPLVFLAAAGLTEAARLIRYRFRNYKEALTLLLCVLPSLLFMLYQNSAMQAFGSEGLGFGPGVAWKVYSDNIPLAVLKVTAFPLTVLAFNFKKLRDNFAYRFTWFQFIVGFAEYYFLYEKGERMLHGNFGWGYQYGIFFLFIESAIVLMNSDNSKGKKAVQWLVFGAHLLCGILYFRKISLGGVYY